MRDWEPAAWDEAIALSALLDGDVLLYSTHTRATGIELDTHVARAVRVLVVLESRARVYFCATFGRDLNCIVLSESPLFPGGSMLSRRRQP